MPYVFSGLIVLVLLTAACLHRRRRDRAAASARPTAALADPLVATRVGP